MSCTHTIQMIKSAPERFSVYAIKAESRGQISRGQLFDCNFLLLLWQSCIRRTIYVLLVKADNWLPMLLCSSASSVSAGVLEPDEAPSTSTLILGGVSAIGASNDSVRLKDGDTSSGADVLLVESSLRGRTNDVVTNCVRRSMS